VGGARREYRRGAERKRGTHGPEDATDLQEESQGRGRVGEESKRGHTAGRVRERKEVPVTGCRNEHTAGRKTRRKNPVTACRKRKINGIH